MEYRCNGQIPVLESTRLVLRRLEESDAEQLYKYWSDPEVVKFMNVPPFADAADTQEMIRWLNLLAETEDTLRWGIEVKSTGRLIGSCGYNTWQLSGTYRAEIGYELGREYWQQGYMFEALEAMFRFGFETMGLNRIEALTFPENTASISLLQKLGFSREGLLREYQKDGDRFVDLFIFSLLRREWEREREVD
ncbi:GNAT family N-acetyltransferase [Paenibacillus pinistramenti]|uniref:GNAT family N-acetyltransferase n=1 Tax=Paenibacillus pinistramenti TaxID=1768003 RepID=UPI0011083452|nr:GNAT family protein [Paenibacillus pinistramenti]